MESRWNAFSLEELKDLEDGDPGSSIVKDLYFEINGRIYDEAHAKRKAEHVWEGTD